MSLLKAVAVLSPLVTSVAAHGYVNYFTANGVNYTNYNPTQDQYMNPVPQRIGWSIPQDLGIGFVAPDHYQNSDIVCHVAATNAKLHAPVAAGSTVTLNWTPWPDTHLGPVINYLANCNGACETVDKTKLQWFKIASEGLETPGSPGTWATSKLIAQGNSWKVQIPSSIAPGNYVLRHEIIALHSAGQVGGAQNYPQCINLQVTGSGTAKPAGVVGTSLYNQNDPSIVFNLYKQNNAYTIPGPAPYTGKRSEVEFES